MHERILAVFAAQGEGWVSGEELSRQLGVSRTAIWKQMESLRQAGYEVEAQTRRGYRLRRMPDALTAAAVGMGLTTERLGGQIEYRESIGSTNEEAKALARRGAAEGLLVIADEQTAGKGRLGRGWSTPKGSAIAMSLVLRPALPPYEAPRLTLVAAVAVAEAVRAVTGLAAGIKWPNDVQLSGRKFCGILTEMEADMDRVAFVVCGIGINVNLGRAEMPAEFRETATSLQEELGRPQRRADLVQAVLTHFESAYTDLLAGRWGAVLERWRALSVTLGQRVRVLSAAGGPPLLGTAEAVDPDGALLVRTEPGDLVRVLAGEVSIRPA